MDLDRGGHTSALPQRVLRTLGRVNAPPIVQRHPALRWLAPLAVAGVVGVVATGVFRASATSSSEAMPGTSAQSLLAAVQRPVLTGFSGTVVSRLSLGLPELPSFGAPDSDSSTSLTSLLSGSHTLKVWYGGPTQQRIALLGASDETDLFRSGRHLWQWTSGTHTATRFTLPKHASANAEKYASPQATPQPSLTPGGVADDLLRRLDPSTSVTVSADHRIADRDAYEMVLRPRTSATTIGSVRIAVDGATKLPLGVQVFARGSRSPSIDVEYTSISFDKPADTSFVFNPPDYATVRHYDLRHPTGSSEPYLPAGGAAAGATDADGVRTPVGPVTTLGTGWSTIWRLQLDAKASKGLTKLERGPLADAATVVKGSWGTGRLFTSDLASVLVLDDGRVLAGAVDPAALYAAAK